MKQGTTNANGPPDVISTGARDHPFCRRLRHTFITRLARSGVVPAVAKSLARHSTIVLTMDHYTHTLIGDKRAALDRLPCINATGANVAALAATGT
jgi:integrase